MRYRIASATDGQLELVFSMPERPLIIVFLSLMALVCLLLGLSFAIGGTNQEDGLRAIAFTGFGLFCLSAMFLLSSGLAFPARLIFDNQKSWLTLVDRRGQNTAQIPYDGIAGFSVCRTMYDRVRRYSMGMDLVRGGRWELYASQNEKKASSFKDTVSRFVQPGVPPTGPISSSSPAGGLLTFDRSTPGKLCCAWSWKAPPFVTAVSVIVLLSFIAALVGIRPFSAGPGAYAVALAFGGFFLITAVISVLRILGRRTEVVIGAGSIECRRTAALVREKRFTMTFSQIASVDLSMSFSRIGTRIVFLRPEEVEKFVRFRQGTFRPSETVDLVSFLRRLPQIDVSALSAGERFTLAEIIREAVRTRTAPQERYRAMPVPPGP